jgi:starch synthase (maltosyl-transferring)
VTLPTDGRCRVVIEDVRPALDGGRFPVKRVLGDAVVVEADAIADGHDQIACMLLHAHGDADAWLEVPMRAIGNDTWRASFTLHELGVHRFTVTAWIDAFSSWRHAFARRTAPADVEDALRDGADLVRAAAERSADGPGRNALLALAASLESSDPLDVRRVHALSLELAELMAKHPDRTLETHYDYELEIVVERPLARFSSWYEFFPRSAVGAKEAHGTFATAKARLAYVAGMGFDVLYLPPIHPIGATKRKGPNNALEAARDDPGSPWAIGGREGGHTSVHPKLGTLEDFQAFRAEAERLGIEVALDLAFQCSPDHPYVSDRPDWFKRRRDGSVQYAENPPKKYEDIYPFDFASSEWESLWRELRDVVEFWVSQGVSVFRVDNPHTKPFGFWQWLIGDVRSRHPGVIFLAEAFARPRVMYRLAKLGFSQSYTYFTWRNTKPELTDYFSELADRRDYFRPNLWPNTPDILHEYLQFGGRPAFMCRAVLAATLGASYGIYGPAFELLEAEPREPGAEEYRNSEKYQVRRWDLRRDDSLGEFLTRLNAIRRENTALQSDANLRFHDVDNEQLICYSKRTDDLDDIVLVVVNLDPHHAQSGFVELPLADWRMDAGKAYQAHDLLSGGRYLWSGPRNFVSLDPARSPAHVFKLRRHVATERDFDYFV